MGDLIKVAYDKRIKSKIVKDTDTTDTFCWHIKFNDKLNIGTVRKANIKIVDESGTTFHSRVNYIDDTLIIIPIDKYEENVEYTLIIDTNVASETGKSFKKPLEISFSVEDDKLIEKTSGSNRKKGTKQSAKKQKYTIAATYHIGSAQIGGRVTVSSSTLVFQSNSLSSKKVSLTLPIREMSSVDFTKGAGLLSNGIAVFMRNSKSYRFSMGQAQKVVDALKKLIDAYRH